MSLKIEIMNPSVADVLISSATSLVGGVLASWIAIAVIGTRKRIAALAFVTVALVAGLIAVKLTFPAGPGSTSAGGTAGSGGGGSATSTTETPGPSTSTSTSNPPTTAANPDRPVVSVADLVAAAKNDPNGEQGAVTEGSQVSVERFENALAVLGMLNRKWVDGSYGTETVQAVKNFQRSINDRVDGVPGILELKSIASRSGTFTAAP